MNKNKKFADALKIVTDEIKKDPGLYISYQSNIAMMFYDTVLDDAYQERKSHIEVKDMHRLVNEASDNFLRRWCEFTHAEWVAKKL